MKKILAIFIAMTFFSGTVNAEEIYFQEELSSLKALLDECKAKCIDTLYEELAYNTLERFSEYIPKDKENADAVQIEYNKLYMQELYSETKEKLTSYLNGEKEPESFKMYYMSDFSDFKENGRDVYSIGYGHGQMVRNDISNLSDFGATNIHIETGPTKIFTELPSFDVSQASQSVATHSIKNDDEHGNYLDVRSKQSGDYVHVYQMVRVQPNTEYTVGMDALGILNSSSARVTLSVRGNDEKLTTLPVDGSWENFNFTYTTGADETELRFCISIYNEVYMLWADNLYLKNAEGKNLLINGDFEDEYDKKEIEDLKYDINLAEKNNLAVTLLLSPHYFPGNLSQDIYASGSNGFINFNIDRQETREIIENYLRIVCDELKECKGIKNIILSNEPIYNTTSWYDYHAPLFNEWIVKKYDTVENLSEAYGITYNNFSEIIMPKAYENSPIFYDWVEFNEEIFTSWHVWMASILEEYFPDTPLNVKAMNVIPSGEDNRGTMMWGADPEQFNVFSDWAGCDASSYDFNDGAYTKERFLLKMLWYDYLSAVTGKPVYNSEDHVIQNYNTDYGEEYARHIKADLWQGMIHHNRMSTIWHWGRSYDSSSGASNSILHRPDCVYTVGQTSYDVARLSEKIKRISGKKPRVALFYSETSRIYCDDYSSTLFNTYETLLTLGQSVGFVSEMCIDNIYDYDLVIFAKVPNTTKEASEIIEDYASKGGEVVFVGEDNLKYDEYNKTMICPPENAVSIAMENLKTDLETMLKNKGLMRVRIIDNSTGKTAENIEWEFDIDKTGAIVNVISLEGDYNISVFLDGKKLTNLTDELSGEKFSSCVSVKELEPRLLMSPVSKVPAEVENITISGNVVKWNNKDEAYDSANVYTINDNNELVLIGKSYDNSFTLADEKQLIIKSVDFYGHESMGAAVNVLQASPLTAEMNGDKVVVTNTTEKATAGELYIQCRDSDGNINRRISASFVLNPGQTTFMKNFFLKEAGESIEYGVK